MGGIRLTVPILLVLLGLICAGCAADTSDRFVYTTDRFETASVAEDAPAMASDDSAAVQQVADGAMETRQIIANANISLVVKETETAMAGVEQIVSDLGGYLSDVDLSKGRYDQTEELRGSMTLRVPSDSLEEALERLQALATDVIYLNINRQDVTDQYSDLDAQLRNLRATETELLALLTEVREKPNAKVEDILAVHRSLTQIREGIETLQGRKNLLDNQIGFSTIRVELISDSINRPIVEEPWSASGPVRNALRALVSTLQGLLTALIWALLYLTPLLLVVLIPLAILIWLVRFWVSRRRKNEE